MTKEKRNKKRILVAIDWFDPAYRAGGPIRSVLNLCLTFSREYDFFIFTGNTDVGSAFPLEGIEYNKWIPHTSGAMVYYSDSFKRSKKDAERILLEVDPDWIYLNSMFSVAFTLNFIIGARRQSMSHKVILAPRGMLKTSALGQKTLKKKTFLFLFRLFGLSRSIRYHATNDQEADEIRDHLGGNDICIAPNLAVNISSRPLSLGKNIGELAILLVGRIHPIKNILGAIKSVSAVKGAVELKIIGVMEDENYWQTCCEVIDKMPGNVKITYVGEAPPAQLELFYERCHVFLLPTLGENFGHAIVEALGRGRPVLVSDNTPWNDLANSGAGWNFPVEAVASFTEALQIAVEWDQRAFEQASKSATAYLNDKLDMANAIAMYRELFN